MISMYVRMYAAAAAACNNGETGSLRMLNIQTLLTKLSSFGHPTHGQARQTGEFYLLLGPASVLVDGCASVATALSDVENSDAQFTS